MVGMSSVYASPSVFITVNGPINRGASLFAPRFVTDASLMPSVDNSTRSPTWNTFVFLRPRLSAASFCRSAASCRASRTKRVTAWRCRTNSDTDSSSMARVTGFGAKFAARGAAARVAPGLINVSAVQRANEGPESPGVEVVRAWERVTAFTAIGEPAPFPAPPSVGAEGIA